METFCRYYIFITSLCWFCSCQAHFGQLQYIAQCWRNDDDLLFWVRQILILRPHLYAHICQKFPKTTSCQKIEPTMMENSPFSQIKGVSSKASDWVMLEVNLQNTRLTEFRITTIIYGLTFGQLSWCIAKISTNTDWHLRRG